MRKEIEEYNIVRVLATILVVMGHCAYTSMITEHGGITFNVQYAPIHEWLLLMVRFIYSFHMPLFFALSGALFSRSYKEKKWKNAWMLIKEKLRKLIYPLLVVGLIYSLPIKIFCGYYSTSNNIMWDAFVGQYILFDNCYLWFLASLFWIFLFTWIMIKLIKKISLRIGILILLYFVGNVFSYNYLGLPKAFLNLIWFYLGMTVDEKRYQINNLLNKKNTKIAIIVGSFLLYACYVVFLKKNIIMYGFIALSGMAICYLLVLKLSGYCLKKIYLYRVILQYSFGIYLYSDPINYLFLAILKELNCMELYENNFFSLLFYIIRFFISIFIAVLIRKMINFAISRQKEREVFYWKS